jgi:hypothetical protein
MDKKEESAGSKLNRWSFLPELMPGVARLLADKRRELGAEHVAECWQRGVVQLEPGWFYAREGAVAIGTAWADLETLRADTPLQGQALVVMRNSTAGVPAEKGTHE